LKFWTALNSKCFRPNACIWFGFQCCGCWLPHVLASSRGRCNFSVSRHFCDVGCVLFCFLSCTCVVMLMCDEGVLQKMLLWV